MANRRTVIEWPEPNKSCVTTHGCSLVTGHSAHNAFDPLQFRPEQFSHTIPVHNWCVIPLLLPYLTNFLTSVCWYMKRQFDLTWRSTIEYLQFIVHLSTIEGFCTSLDRCHGNFIFFITHNTAWYCFPNQLFRALCAWSWKGSIFQPLYEPTSRDGWKSNPQKVGNSYSTWLYRRLIDCMVFNAVFKIQRRPVHLSMLPWSFL